MQSLVLQIWRATLAKGLAAPQVLMEVELVLTLKALEVVVHTQLESTDAAAVPMSIEEVEVEGRAGSGANSSR